MENALNNDHTSAKSFEDNPKCDQPDTTISESDSKTEKNIMNVTTKKENVVRVHFPAFAVIRRNAFEERETDDDRQTFLKSLGDFSNQEQNKKDFLEFLEKYSLSQPEGSMVGKINEFITNTDLKGEKVLDWYCKDESLRQVVSDCLKINSSNPIYDCRWILKSLKDTIKERYQKGSTNYNGLLTGELLIDDPEWDELQKHLGKVVELYDFLLMKRNEDEISLWDSSNDHNRALLSIVVPDFPDKKHQEGFVEFSRLEDSQQSGEVLFNLMSRFKIIEAGTKNVNGSQRRHLVLLYNPDEIEKFLQMKLSTVGVQIDQSKKVECHVCLSEININQASVFFIDLSKADKYACDKCFQQCESPLLCVYPATQNLFEPVEQNLNLVVEGLVMQYQESTKKMPFFGYRCAECQRTEGERFYKCLSCLVPNRVFCSNCLKQKDDCAKKGHLLVLENQPFRFWSRTRLEEGLEPLDSSNASQLDKSEIQSQKEQLLTKIDQFEKFTKHYIFEKNKTKNVEEDPEQEDFIVLESLDKVLQLFMQEVIWYDQNDDSQENSVYRNTLKSICGSNAKTFTDWKEACAYIRDNETSMHVIISGPNAEECTKDILDKKNVSSVILFGDTVESQAKWAKKYKRVCCAGSNFGQLKEKITKQIVRLDFPAFAPIFSEMNKSEINYLHLYLKGFARFKNREQSKRDFVSLAKRVYSQNSKFIRDIETFENEYTQYNMTKILHWYTKETFLYKLINNCLRLATIDSLLYCRLALKDMQIAVKEGYELQKSNRFSGLLYRGAFMSDKEWSQLQQNIGKEIEMYGFLSTTKSPQIAIFFSQKNEKKVLIKIIVPPAPDLWEQGFVDLKDMSDFAEEEEILFNIMSRFRILEATTEMVNDFETRLLILLYGAHEIKMFNRLKNPVNELAIPDLGIVRCKICNSNVIKSKSSLFYVDLSQANEYTCQDCFKSISDDKSTSNLLCLSPCSKRLFDTAASEGEGMKIKFEGVMMKYKERMDLGFFGYECIYCKEKRFKNSYKCLDCEQTTKTCCEKCFEKDSDCVKKGHLVVLEREPFSFWNEKMTDAELEQIAYQMNLSEKANSLSRLDRILNETHQYKKEIDLYMTVIPKLADQDKRAVFIRLGMAHHDLGEFDQAIYYMTKSLETTIAIYGENHLSVATIFNNLALAYHDLGKYSKAVEFYKKSLEIRISLLGDKHSSTAAIVDSMGAVYRDMGQYDKAIEFLTKGLETRKSVLGDKHPAIASSFNNMARTYNELGRYEKAVEFFEKALEITRLTHGDKHPATANYYGNLGLTYKLLGKYEKSIDCQTKAIEITRSVYGENHPSTATACNNIALVYQDMGEYEKSIQFYMKSLDVLLPVYGDKHPSIATCFNNLGSAFNDIGKHDKAIEFHTKSLDAMRLVYGEDHPSVATCYDNIGSAYDCLEQYEKGLEFHMKSLDIEKKIYGEKHPSIAFSFNNVGSSYCRLGNYEKAIEFLKKALEIRRSTLGEKHPDTVGTLWNLGMVYDSMKDYEKAKDIFSKSWENVRSLYGEKHPFTMNSLITIASAYEKLGSYQKALEFYTKSLERFKLVHGEQHQTTVFIRSKINSINSNAKSV